MNANAMQSLGALYPRAIITDPMMWHIMDEFKRHDQRVYVGPDSTLARLPYYPGFRAQAI